MMTANIPALPPRRLTSQTIVHSVDKPSLIISLSLAVFFSHRTTNFNVVSHTGKWLLFKGPATLHHEWTGSQCSLIMRMSLLVMRMPLSQNYQIWHANTMSDSGMYLGVSRDSQPKRVKFQRFPISGALVFLSTSFDAKERNSAR